MGASASLSHDKREAILNGAAEVFAAHGYEGASMSMITAAACVSKGTIYQHFDGKAALFGAALAASASAGCFRCSMAAPTPPTSPPRCGTSARALSTC
jgi:AcrR family transcriptional regulator